MILPHPTSALFAHLQVYTWRIHDPKIMTLRLAAIRPLPAGRGSGSEWAVSSSGTHTIVRRGWVQALVGGGSIILVGRIWGSMTHLGRWGTPGGTEWRVIGKIMKER